MSFKVTKIHHVLQPEGWVAVYAVDRPPYVDVIPLSHQCLCTIEFKTRDEQGNERTEHASRIVPFVVGQGFEPAPHAFRSWGYEFFTLVNPFQSQLLAQVLGETELKRYNNLIAQAAHFGQQLEHQKAQYEHLLDNSFMADEETDHPSGSPFIAAIEHLMMTDDEEPHAEDDEVDDDRSSGAGAGSGPARQAAE